MIEREMGNRGSKSNILITLVGCLFLFLVIIIFVKEQRVDGSYCDVLLSFTLQLRYTLMGFERNYPIKIPSKQLNSSFFSTSSHEKAKLNPYFVSGLIDAEGCFTTSIYKDTSYKSGWRVQPFFQIGLNIRDKELLCQLQEFFGGVGTFRIDARNNIIIYSVSNRKDLKNIIIPHFKVYPLLTQKGADLLLFEQIVELMAQGAHQKNEGLQQIINIKASLNLGISDILKSEFNQTVPVERLIIETKNIPDPHWVSGFASGESNFYSGIKESQNKKGHIVFIRFTISQHARDTQLLELLINYLDAGRLDKNKAIVNLVVDRFSDLRDKIIPFFNKYPVLGIKNLDYSDWCRIANLKNAGAHLTFEGLEEIKKIKSGMNRGRK